MKLLRKPFAIVTGFAMILIALQFIERPVANPPADHPLKAPAAVVAILEKSCYDCHSNRTSLRWYDQVAPASWLVNAHVKEARSRFNFSTWDTLSPAAQNGFVWEFINMVQLHQMPLGSYTAVHPDAKLTSAALNVLKQYAASISPVKYHDTAVIAQADKEFAQFIAGEHTNTAGLKTVNGIDYIPGFRHWTVISATDRFDFQNVRVVYANDIMVKAIESGNTGDFPQGSTIVKACWNTVQEANGDIRPGSVNSIQIITKDNKRFPDSKGWGFAKFLGYKLKPYGATPLFNATCFHCHQMAKEQDYVFNLPPADANGKRTIYDAGGLQVITSFANRAQHTMSILYGNPAGRKSALAGYQQHTPGEQYKLVTYKEVVNPFWYGSYINGPVQSVENIRSGPTGQLAYSVEQGAAPQAAADVRMAEIFAHRASVFP